MGRSGQVGVAAIVRERGVRSVHCGASSRHASRKETTMIVRIDIDQSAGSFGYRVSYEAEELYGDDSGLESLVECLIAAVEGMPPEAVAAELWYDGVVSGTYPLSVIGMNVDQVALHAQNTTAMIDEVAPDRKD
jgi:hypothetical protein